MMFHEMRRKEKALTDEKILTLISHAEYGVLSTIGNDGYPYGVPVNFIYQDGSIYFHCAKEGHKVENIRSNDQVSFCIVDDVELIPAAFNTKFKSVIAFGKVCEVEENRKQEIFECIIEKFSDDFRESGMEYIKKAGENARVFQIKVQHLSGKCKE